MKSAMIHARVEPGLKQKVESIFANLGISATEAITIYYKQVALRNGLPFEVRIPNRTTARTFKGTDDRRNLKRFDSVDALFKDLNS